MIVLLGASGQVGTALAPLLPDVRTLRRADLDLAEATPGEVRTALAGAAAVVNCAAYTAVDRAEAEEELATRVNGRAVGMLAEVTAEMGVPFVTYSTDYVFPGDGDRPYLESHPTGPVNAYGRSKLEGEQRALAANPRALVIRTSWVISGTHPNFVATILRRAAETVLRVVDDQRGCPTIAADLAAGTLRALEVAAGGLLHLTNGGDTTWFELARTAVRLAGMDPEVVEPCSTDEYPTPAARPAYSVLGSERREPLGIPALPHWRDSLPDVVAAQLVRLG